VFGDENGDILLMNITQTNDQLSQSYICFPAKRNNNLVGVLRKLHIRGDQYTDIGFYLKPKGRNGYSDSSSGIF
jgi:hypothetical protein